MADYEQTESSLNGYMQKLNNPKVKEKFKIIKELESFILDRKPYLNLDQIDLVLQGEEDEGLIGLC